MSDESTDGQPASAPDTPEAFVQYQPTPSVMNAAFRRIRARRNDVRTLNELFDALSSLMRGLATLFGSDKFTKGGRHE